MRWGTVALVAVAFALAVPATAAAATRYVAKGGADAPGCTNPGSPCLTISYAVTQANGGDTIQIGPGIFTESVETSKPLTFVGAGAGTLDGIPYSTLIHGLQGTNDPGEPGLELHGGGALRALRIEGGTGDESASPLGEAGGAGVYYSSVAPGATSLELDHVLLVGGAGGEGMLGPGSGGYGLITLSGPGSVALSAHDSEFAAGLGLNGGNGIAVVGENASAQIRNSQIESSSKSFGAGVEVLAAAATLESVDIAVPESAVTVRAGSMTIMRSRLQAGGIGVYVPPNSGEHAEVRLVDSLVFSTNYTAAYVTTKDPGTTAALNAIGSTLIGLNGIGAVVAIRYAAAGPSTVILRNSIARHLRPPGLPAHDLYVEGGTIDADFSSFMTRLEEKGGTATAPGSGSNLAVDPQFVDPSKGNFALQGTSPLIDRGNPALAGAGELDLAGSPRSLDGNRDCVAAPDIGAFEVTGQDVACDLAPTISKFGMTNRVFAPKVGEKKRHRARSSARKTVKRGTRFTYTLSKPAKVTIAIERKKTGRKGKRANFAKATALGGQESQGPQSTPFSAVVKGKPLKPGRYRATITATDAAGQASAPQRLSFKIVSG